MKERAIFSKIDFVSYTCDGLVKHFCLIIIKKILEYCSLEPEPLCYVNSLILNWQNLANEVLTEQNIFALFVHYASLIFALILAMHNKKIHIFIFPFKMPKIYKSNTFQKKNYHFSKAE